jgi:hypothetical protein
VFVIHMGMFSAYPFSFSAFTLLPRIAWGCARHDVLKAIEQRKSETNLNKILALTWK